ncbi:transcriptional regulator [Actinomadura sp. WAC 06369]|uniref:transcriptional regulator n=1 Tax=Actinomadura sp. WAC 06369 TaxID=2203193 RepID=UPI000F76DF88|nr:transcriptional regulator [Actinomadura sp. WAC 06369]RSN69967.1 transcriptional regulator [Actinomadura sp. WAC 06369]
MDGEARWRDERAALDGARARLGEVADGLYPDVPRVAGTPLRCADGWVPDAPVPLGDVRLAWDPAPPPPAVAAPPDGLPPGYRTYAEALGALAPPAVFEDRPAYRLVAVEPPADRPVLRLSPARYFDGVNVGEAVAHELAAGRRGLRDRIGDPCDLARRTVLPAITTVTLTASGTYLLHRRDPAKVAHAGGLLQVMPVGVFQPLRAADERRDLDLWRCMVREYAEEVLGRDEDYGAAFDQDAWPFHRALTAARTAGRARAHLLGIGVDPLTLALDVLTAVVFDDDAFAELFGDAVEVNAEGEVARAPFDGTVPAPMQPAGAAALELAWRHREALRVTPSPVSPSPVSPPRGP